MQTPFCAIMRSWTLLAAFGGSYAPGTIDTLPVFYDTFHTDVYIDDWHWPIFSDVIMMSCLFPFPHLVCNSRVFPPLSQLLGRWHHLFQYLFMYMYTCALHYGLLLLLTLLVFLLFQTLSLPLKQLSIEISFHMS